MNRLTMLLLAVLALAGAPAQAQVDLSRLGLSRAQITALNAQLTAPAIAPAIAFGSPVAFGADWGQAYFGIGGQTIPASNARDYDGAMTLGFGLLDPVAAVGLDAAVTAISLIEGTGEDGNVHLKAHRALGRAAAVAVGGDNIATWGDARGTDASYYGVYTRLVELSPDTPRTPWALAVNVGLGNERFVDPGEDAVGVFGSLALAPVRRASLIVDWSGRDLNAAVSVVPVRDWPLVVTAGFINLTGNHAVDTEFAGGLGWLWRF